MESYQVPPKTLPIPAPTQPLHPDDVLDCDSDGSPGYDGSNAVGIGGALRAAQHARSMGPAEGGNERRQQLVVGSLPQRRQRRRSGSRNFSAGGMQTSLVAADPAVDSLNLASSMPPPHAPFLSYIRDSSEQLSRVPNMELPESATDDGVMAMSVPYGSLRESGFQKLYRARSINVTDSGIGLRAGGVRASGVVGSDEPPPLNLGDDPPTHLRDQEGMLTSSTAQSGRQTSMAHSQSMPAFLDTYGQEQIRRRWDDMGGAAPSIAPPQSGTEPPPLSLQGDIDDTFSPDSVPAANNVVGGSDSSSLMDPLSLSAASVGALSSQLEKAGMLAASLASQPAMRPNHFDLGNGHGFQQLQERTLSEREGEQPSSGDNDYGGLNQSEPLLGSSLTALDVLSSARRKSEVGLGVRLSPEEVQEVLMSAKRVAQTRDEAILPAPRSGTTTPPILQPPIPVASQQMSDQDVAMDNNPDTVEAFDLDMDE